MLESQDCLFIAWRKSKIKKIALFPEFIPIAPNRKRRADRLKIDEQGFAVF